MGPACQPRAGDRLFSADGPPRLALITCGGAFDQAADSYRDDVVAYAVPAPTASGWPQGWARAGTGTGRILVPMSKWTAVAGALWVGLTVLAFLVDPILGACVLIFGGIGVVVVQLGATWNEHPDFEARELDRARRRKVKWDKGAKAREKDAARYAAAQAKKSAGTRSTDRA